MALTEKQKIFCDEYLIDCNATRAYREDVDMDLNITIDYGDKADAG